MSEQQQQLPPVMVHNETDAFQIQPEAVVVPRLEGALPQLLAPHALLPAAGLATALGPRQLERIDTAATAKAAITTWTNTNIGAIEPMNIAVNNNHNPPQLRYAVTGGITLPMGTQMFALPPPIPPPVFLKDPPLMTVVPPSMEEDLWACHKCKKANLVSKARCGSCQSWRGGKREGYGLKRKLAGAQQILLQPQLPWTCPCGNSNKPNKVRCIKCQKWKGGKRMNKGTVATQWYAQQMAQLAMETNTTHLPWDCDRCGNNNQAGKVRCMACPRWKNGKRPKIVKKAAAQQQNMLSPAAVAHAFAVGRPPRVMGSQQFDGTMAQGNWFCLGCNHLNNGKKRRCGACQRWKFGKRENMLKKNRLESGPTPTIDDTYLMMATECEASVGAPPPHNVDALVDRLLDPQPSWPCVCGQANLAQKTRCSSCQKWKGGKRGNLPRKAKQVGTATADAKTTDVPGMPAVAKVMPHQQNMPWKCAGCGNDNDLTKLRCGTCQSWKNGKKQLSQRAESIEAVALLVQPIEQARQQQTQALSASAASALALLPQAPADGALHTLPWECHGCKSLVPGTKNRCPGCKSWKGGKRENIGKKKLTAQPWTCTKCKTENGGKRSRCCSCQSWRGGKRPDVALRRLEDQVLRGNWICEKCQKTNKPSKVRCGGCQRWRGGQRPDMRKSAKSTRAPVPNEPQQYQPPTQNLRMKNVAPIPPTQMLYQMPVVAQPGVQPPALLGQALMNSINTSNVPAQNQTPMGGSPHPAQDRQVWAAQAPGTNLGKTDAGLNSIWTCTKCTCENPVSEIICKICHGSKDGWLVTEGL